MRTFVFKKYYKIFIYYKHKNTMKKLLFVLALSTLIFTYGCGKKTNVDVNVNSGATETGVVVDATWALDNADNTTEVADNTNEEVASGTAAVVDIKGKYTFEDANCQKYVSLMECLVDKTPAEGKGQTVQAFTKVMELWTSLNKDQLPDVCKQSMDALASQSEVFANAGCPLDQLENNN